VTSEGNDDDSDLALIAALGFDIRKVMAEEYTRGVTDGWNLAVAATAKGEPIEAVRYYPPDPEPPQEN